ncbi:MAG: acyl dehydratase, partial [Promethearchaeota archaeon]
MVKISDLKVGDKIKNEFDQINRKLLRKYAKASGDTNPIHTNDAIAEKAGLKGVIAHGLFSFGFA